MGFGAPPRADPRGVNPPHHPTRGGSAPAPPDPRGASPPHPPEFIGKMKDGSMRLIVSEAPR